MYFIYSLSNFFISNVKKLSHKTIQNICLLAFADGLIELLKKKPGDLIFRYNGIYPNSQVINDKLLDNFVDYSVTGRYIMKWKKIINILKLCLWYVFNFPRELSPKMKDKAVCHIIVIMVLINMNVIDLSAVSPFLPLSSQKR